MSVESVGGPRSHSPQQRSHEAEKAAEARRRERELEDKAHDKAVEAQTAEAVKSPTETQTGRTVDTHA